MDNPDHYKYMPHRPDEKPEEVSHESMDAPEGGSLPISEVVDETIVIMEVEESASDVRIPLPERPTERDTDKDTLQIREPIALMIKGILKFFYDFFNPFLIPAYATLLIFELSLIGQMAPGASIFYTLIVLGISCLIPLGAIVFLRWIGAIDSISLRRRKERSLPYFIMLLAMGGLSVFFMVKGAAPWIYFVFWGASATILLNFLINLLWRVSNHCSAIAALLATLIVINNDAFVHPSIVWWIIGTLLIAGIMGSGAIILGRHNLRDVLIGYATGFLPIILFHV